MLLEIDRKGYKYLREMIVVDNNTPVGVND